MIFVNLACIVSVAVPAAICIAIVLESKQIENAVTRNILILVAAILAGFFSWMLVPLLWLLLTGSL